MDQPSGPSFSGDLAAPEPLSDAAVDAALAVMRDGRLFRYGEVSAGIPETALLEEEFAAMQGAKYCAAVNSGGCALFLSLKAAGVEPGDKVLLNAFTLAPVPGAIAHAGAEAVLVDIDDRLVIDLDDLERKAEASGARTLLLSHMRGHIADLDAVAGICERRGLTLIEDCAHTTGAKWADRLTGSFGAVGCFSAQSYKHVNGGEGGLIVTDDDDIAARAVLMSGSYMLYAQHRARPGLDVFERWRGVCPNFSMRMNGLTAALLRPQLAEMPTRNTRWREIYDRIAAGLAGQPGLRVPARPQAEAFTPTSIQFLIDRTPEGIGAFLAAAAARGVHIKWFGADQPVGFTSRFDHWAYLNGPHDAPNAERLLHQLCDVRLPSWLSDADCDTIAEVILTAQSETA